MKASEAPEIPHVSVPGGSWVVISKVISKITIVITQIKGLITPLITAHEPPSEVETMRRLLSASGRTARHYRSELLGIGRSLSIFLGCQG